MMTPEQTKAHAYRQFTQTMEKMALLNRLHPPKPRTWRQKVSDRIRAARWRLGNWIAGGLE